MRALAERGIEAVGLDVSLELVDGGGGDGRRPLPLLLVRRGDGGPHPRRRSVRRRRLQLLAAGRGAGAAAVGPAANLAPGGALVIQTVHPWTAAGDEPYADGWRTETFDAFGAEFAEPMPWYFRTLESWVDALHGAGFRLAALREPVHPGTRPPVSLLMVAEPVPGD